MGGGRNIKSVVIFSRNDLYCVGWDVKLYIHTHILLPGEFFMGETF